MKYLLLTFDIEEFDELRIRSIEDNVEKQCAISADGLNNVLDLLKKHKIKATFFTTCVFAMNEERLIKRLLKEGHELGLHAYRHKDDYTCMNQDMAFRILADAKNKLEKKFKIKIKGFRGPQMRRPSYAVLKKLGFVYDSSLHPTWMPGYYNNILKKRKIHEIGGIKEIPLSVAPIFRFSLAWIFFRLLPLAYSKIITRMNLIDMNYANLYFHPWEFTDIDSWKFKKLNFVLRKKTGKENVQKLENYIEWCKKKNIRAATISEYLHAGCEF